MILAAAAVCIGVSLGKRPVRFTDETLARYVDDIFFNYDSNNDQYLDRQESLQFYKEATGVEAGEIVDMDEFQEWQGIIDANGDSKLSWNEIYALTESAASS